LLTHGNEELSAGGPTKRVPHLASMLRARGHDVLHLANGKILDGHRFDIVHVFNSWPFGSCIKALLEARKTGGRVVFSPIALDLHLLPIFQHLLGAILNVRDSWTIDCDLDDIVRRTPPQSYFGTKRPLEGVPGQFEALRNAITMADQVICLSRYERDFLGAIGARVAHSMIVENSSNFEGFADSNPDAFRRKFGLGEYVLCVGRLEYRKNQALLAHAMRGLRCQLALIGHYVDHNYVELIHKYAQRNVIYVGPINDRPLLASAYAGANAVFVPSWSEGASLVAIEAGYLGTPLVLSTLSAEREYFGEWAQYVHPADVAAMRSSIEGHAHTGADAARRSALAAFTRRKFEFSRHVEATLAVYRAAGAQPDRPAPDPIVIDLANAAESVDFGRAARVAAPARMIVGARGERRSIRAFAWAGQANGFAERGNGLSGDGVPSPGSASRSATIHSDRRAVAHISADARPDYKDYGVPRRIPRDGAAGALPIALGNLAYYLHGAIRRRLKRHRRANLLAGFRAAPVGGIVEMEVPVPSFDIPAACSALIFGSALEEGQLAELMSLAETKGVRLEAVVGPPEIRGADTYEKRWHMLFRHCAVVHASNSEVEQALRKLRRDAGLTFEVRVLAAAE
jgi:glycosyltransferase involved in cell wall biosynthesis